jgi:hypothetical protein
VNLAKRLTRIETSLTPKQAVLLWLKEAQQLDLKELLEKSFTCPMHEAPPVRIPEMVEKAVCDTLSKKGMKPESIAHAALEAWKQADFLFVLLCDVQQEVMSFSFQNCPYVLLLHEKLCRMLEHFCEDETFDPEAWDMWRMVLIDRLTSAWLLRETIKKVSEKYYDNSPLLFSGDENGFNRSIDSLETLANRYNSLEGGLPLWSAIDFAALSSLIEGQVAAAVGERVAGAKAQTLRALGEWKAAWDLVEPYALAKIEESFVPHARCANSPE